MGIKFTDFPIRGIDVSTHNGVIDWTKVKCGFVAIRVGYGNTVDSKFIENIVNASKQDLDIIYYWYMDYYNNHISTSSVYEMSDADWGRKQAQNCWSLIKDYRRGVVFLDIESTNGNYAPKIQEVQSRVHRIARAFLEEIDRLSGKKNGMYIAVGWLDWYPDWFRDRPLWVAWYPYRTANISTMAIVQMVIDKGWKTKPLFWQYASDGDLDDDGDGDGRSMGMQYATLDLNGWVGTQVEYAALFGTVAIPETPDDEAVVIPQPEFNGYIITAWPYLLIREGASTSSKKLGLYYQNSKVYVSGISNGWAKLYGQPGYISEKYLK